MTSARSEEHHKVPFSEYEKIVLLGRHFFAESGVFTNSQYYSIISKAIDIVGDASWGILLTRDGDLFASGRNHKGQLGITGCDEVVGLQKVKLPNNDKIVKIQASSAFVVCLTDKGQLISFGEGYYGELGRDTRVSAKPDYIPIGKLVKDFTVGGLQCYAITDQANQVYSWGFGASGRLGNNTTTDQKLPVLMTPLLQYELLKIYSTGGHAVATTSCNRVLVFGNNVYGQLGYPTLFLDEQRVDITELSAFRNVLIYSVSTNYNGTIITTVGIPPKLRKQVLAAYSEEEAQEKQKMLEDVNRRHVFVFGNNSSLQFGQPSVKNAPTICYQRRLSEMNVKQIFSGMNHNLALMHDGRVFGCGETLRDQMSATAVLTQHTGILLEPTELTKGAYRTVEELPFLRDVDWIICRSNFALCLCKRKKHMSFSRSSFMDVIIQSKC